jgi:cob(I)alamin adenosyltransferase
MISVSTKKGDQGQSTLIGSKKIDKDSLVFTVLGDTDELNSWVGLVVSHLDSKTTKSHLSIKRELLDVQKKLFILSAQIAGSGKVKLTAKDLKKIDLRSKKIQQSMSKNWHSKFIYPGGCKEAACTDLARAVCRRVERSIVAYNKEYDLPPLILQYINRLSDYLYLVRCQLNDLMDIDETEFN